MAERLECTNLCINYYTGNRCFTGKQNKRKPEDKETPYFKYRATTPGNPCIDPKRYELEE